MQTCDQHLRSKFAGCSCRFYGSVRCHCCDGVDMFFLVCALEDWFAAGGPKRFIFSVFAPGLARSAGTNYDSGNWVAFVILCAEAHEIQHPVQNWLGNISGSLSDVCYCGGFMHGKQLSLILVCCICRCVCVTLCDKE